MTETESNIPDQVKEQHEQAMTAWQAAQQPSDSPDTPDAVGDETADNEPLPPDDPPAVDSSQEDGWKHKYNVLKGKYDAELPRALDEARYWRDRCDQLQSEVERVRMQPPAPQAQTPAEPEIPAELVDTLGEDGARIVAKMLAKQRQEIEGRMGSQLQNTAQLSQQSAANVFWSRVTQALPNYAEMEDDPGLKAWLSQSWPGSRRTRLEEAHDAAQRLDAEAFIGLLQAYQPATTPTQERKPPAPTPRRAAGGGEPPPQQSVMTAEEYQAKARQITDLRQDGHYQKAADLQKELDAAKRDGRIQQRAYAADYS